MLMTNFLKDRRSVREFKNKKVSLDTLNSIKSYLKVYGPYYMEKLITELNRLGLETCWVSVGNLEREFKNTVFGEHTGNIDYILAIGYGKRRNPFTNEPFSERIGVEELVYSGGIEKKIDNEELEHRGLDDLFYYVRFAPSNANLEPWRFLLEKDKITLFIKYREGEEPNLADAGIIMYYFSELARSMGIESEWKLIEGSHVGEDGIYEYIGEIKI